jgi:ketosteroid isomerase-like protein
MRATIATGGDTPGVGNMEIVRSGYEALERRGVEGFLEFIHQDFSTTTPAALAAEPDTYAGHDGIRRYFDSFYEAMDEVRFEPRRLTEIGDDMVMAETVLHARGRATGIETEQEVVMLWTIRDGKGYRVETYATVDEARSAAGAG